MDGDSLLGELRRAFAYDPDTGIVSWKITNKYHPERVPGLKAGANKEGYVQVVYTDSDGVRHQIRAHRLAWWVKTGRLPDEIDHVDRDRSNNRWANLREVTRTQNLYNADLQRNNRSGKTGVSWRSRESVWVAQINVGVKKIVTLGYFDRLEDAIQARRAAEMEYLGALCPS